MQWFAVVAAADPGAVVAVAVVRPLEVERQHGAERAVVGPVAGSAVRYRPAEAAAPKPAAFVPQRSMLDNQ